MTRWFKKAWEWLDDRTGISDVIVPMARHLVPPDARWWYVFGSATMCAFVIQIVSGVALAFAYIPSTSDAYETLQFITHDAPFGRFLRGMHYYGASAMVLMVGLHMAQVYLFAAYKYPREMNWTTGVLLLVFTMIMGFTGQLLRWDQNAVWSVVVAAEQAGRVPFIGDWLARFLLGGETVGGATLSRFFAIHVFLIPALMFMFVGIHIFLVLRHGISEPPKPGKLVDPKTYKKEYAALLKKEGVPFWPYAAWRDIVFCVAMIAGMALLSLTVGPPALDKPPDPSIIEAYPRPDWYFLWYFAVLALLPHGLEQYAIVLGPLLIAVLLLSVPFLSNKGERSPRRRPWAIAAVFMTVLMIGTFWIAGEKSNWSPNFNPDPLPAGVIGAKSGPVADGGRLFNQKGCLSCHLIEGYGGRRGPNLTTVGNRLSNDQLTIWIMNGGVNMPAYAGNLTSEELDALVAFLNSRKTGWRTEKISQPTLEKKP
jgi:ubiquinol-cytochrome c reductase cytochrome b subunit